MANRLCSPFKSDVPISAPTTAESSRAAIPTGACERPGIHSDAGTTERQ